MQKKNIYEGNMNSIRVETKHDEIKIQYLGHSTVVTKPFICFVISTRSNRTQNISKGFFLMNQPVDISFYENLFD